IEVLRGPQGLLFGRNVTGGAVLLRTTRPTDELSINARVAGETGSNQYYSAAIAGPLSDAVGGKVAAYYNDDGGWHTNLFNGEDFGKAETKLFRAALEFTPTDVWDVMLRLEHGDSSGDGPASQNAGLFRADTFDFSIDNTGFYDSEWDQAIVEVTVDAGPGDGQFVNILGWRQYDSRTNGDIDASPFFVFHALSSTDHEQISNELRYTTTVGRTYVTTGLYYLSQDLAYREQRLIPPAMLNITGGGDQEQSTWGLFSNLDIGLTDEITLNLGARYSQEEKEGKVANIFTNRCVIGGSCSGYDLDDKETWSSITPKIGFQIMPSEDTQMYAFWTRGFRSGGYNMRHTSFTIPNEVFDEEKQSSYEVGLKRDMAGGRVRINAAAYYNEIEDLQRELNLSDSIVGVVQLIRNTADATITGFDLELSAVLSDSLFLRASLGYVDGSYDEVRADLNGDGVVDSADRQLALPRLAPWSYGGELIYSRD
ncbi:MAG: TonB-dependent receptor, partial [Woeseiaceae bacterium]